MVHDFSCWFSFLICAFNVGYHFLETQYGPASEPASTTSPSVEAAAASSSSAVPAEVKETLYPPGAPLHIQKHHPSD